MPDLTAGPTDQEWSHYSLPMNGVYAHVGSAMSRESVAKWARKRYSKQAAAEAMYQALLVARANLQFLPQIDAAIAKAEGR